MVTNHGLPGRQKLVKQLDFIIMLFEYKVIKLYGFAFSHTEAV